MPVTINKQQKKTVVQPVSALTEAKAGLNAVLEDTIIEGTHYQAQVNLFTAKLKEAKSHLDEQAAKVKEAVEESDLDPKSTIEVTTDNGSLYVGVEPEKTTITNTKALFEHLENLKPGLAFDLMKFTLTDLKKYLSENELSEVTEVTLSQGKRKITYKPVV